MKKSTERKAAKAIFSKRPILVSPTVATAIGLNEAIVIQQVAYWLDKVEAQEREEHFIEGEWWVYNSYEAWSQQFPFWSIDTVKRTIRKLEESGILKSFQAAGFDRRKWYSIEWSVLLEAIGSVPTHRLVQIAPFDDTQIAPKEDMQTALMHEGQSAPVRTGQIAPNIKEQESNQESTQESSTGDYAGESVVVPRLRNKAITFSTKMLDRLTDAGVKLTRKSKGALIEEVKALFADGFTPADVGRAVDDLLLSERAIFTPNALRSFTERIANSDRITAQERKRIQPRPATAEQQANVARLESMTAQIGKGEDDTARTDSGTPAVSR